MKDEIGEAIELFEAVGRTRTDRDAGEQTASSIGLPAHRFSTVRRLKQRSSDYRPGAVKIYTREEIEAYELHKAESVQRGH